MPHCQAGEIVFTVLIGALTLALTWLTLRENFLQAKGR